MRRGLRIGNGINLGWIDLVPRRGGSGALPSVTYLLQDAFTTNEAAPLASPRTCEPGPGTLTITDTKNRGSIAGNKLVVGAGSGSAVFKAVYDYGSALPKPVGFIGEITASDPFGQFFLNTDGSATNSPGIVRGYTNDLEIYGISSYFAPYVFSTALANPVRMGLIRFSTYFVVLVKDGNIGNGNPFKIVAIQNRADAAARYFVISSYVGTYNANYDNCYLFLPPAVDLYAFAQTNIADAETFTAPAANMACTFTHIAQNGVTQDVMFRRTDDDNCLLLRFTQATGKVRFYRRVTGTETAIGTEGTAAQVAGNSYSVSISAIGNRISWSFNGATDAATEAANNAAIGLKFSNVAADLKICPEFLNSDAINTLA